MVSFLELIDDTLGINFHAPVYDPKKGQEKLVKVIDKAAEQHREGKTPPLRSWKLGNNNAISFAPKLNGNPVLIAGRETIYTPAEQFQEFLERLKAAVQKGELDKEIKAALDGETTNKLGITTGRSTTTVARAPRGEGLGTKAQADNPEWMAKFTAKYGEAPGEGYVPNSKGTSWVTKAAYDRGVAAAAKRKANKA